MGRENRQISFMMFLVFVLFFSGASNAKDSQKDAVLYMPNGPFTVGYQDFDWIDNTACPDPVALAYKPGYFNVNNPKMCRELLVRVYYPAQGPSVSSAYPSLVTQPLQDTLKSAKLLNADVKLCSQSLKYLRLAAAQNLKPIKQTWPFILFSPGAVDNASEDSSMLIELASQGYIVAAVNGSFMTPLLFPNQRLVPANPALSDAKHIVMLYQTKLSDLRYVYQEALKLHQQRAGIFAYINPKRIGLLGHSAGASAVLALARIEGHKIKAVVALDAPNQTRPELNPLLKQANITFPKVFDIFSPFSMPTMQIHSSNAATFLSAPKHAFSLGADNYLVAIQTRPVNVNYFKHMDYTDYALMKDWSCMQRLMQHDKALGQDNPLLPAWGYGDVSGKDAQALISQYLLAFYHSYLYNQPNAALKQCIPLSPNTQIQCGSSHDDV